MSNPKIFQSTRTCPYCGNVAHLNHPYIQLSINCPKCDSIKLDNAQMICQDSSEFVVIAGVDYRAVLREAICTDCELVFRATHNMQFHCENCKKEFRITTP